MEFLEEKVAFEADMTGQLIRGTIIKSNKTTHLSPAVLLIHGMTSNELNYIALGKLLAAKGIISLAINLRGHGEEGNKSDGSRDELTIANGVADGLCAYDFLLQQQGVDPKRIGIVGASFGAAIGAMVVGEKDIKSLVLRVPATYAEDMMQMTDSAVMEIEEKAFNNVGKEEIYGTPAIVAIKKLKGHLLVITSEHDSVIPSKVTRAFFDNATQASSKEHMVIKDATHNLTEDKWKEEFRNKTVEFLVKNL